VREACSTTIAGPERVRGFGLLAALCVAAAVAIATVSFAYHVADRHLAEWLADRVGRVDRVVVDKSDRRLHLLRGNHVLRSYGVALGGNPVGHKEVEGDSRTPEGEYRIDARVVDSMFHRALHISYPNAEDRRFAAAIRRSPGHSIMIHGQPNDLGWLERLRRTPDWTDGCIAVSNRAIEEIWHAVPDGTPITIRP
jgi:murein L,D-transpeptidase YafK